MLDYLVSPSFDPLAPPKNSANIIKEENWKYHKLFIFSKSKCLTWTCSSDFLNCSHFQLFYIVKMNVTYVTITYNLFFPTLIKSVFHSPVVPEDLLHHNMYLLWLVWSSFLSNAASVIIWHHAESFSWQSWWILPLKSASCGVKSTQVRRGHLCAFCFNKGFHNLRTFISL